MIHPARRMVESLHDKGACPRIQVDVTREGVVCPDFVREQWKEQLVIDLDPSYPLNLAFTSVGIEADISFDGFVTRCTFPFDAIYVVVDREKGKGIVLEENMPESIRKKRQAASKPRREADQRAGGKRERQSRRRRRPQSEPKLEAAPEAAPEQDADEGLDEGPDHKPDLRPAVVADAEPDDGESEDTGSNEGVGDEEARRRRSVFQVIDGDG